MGKGISTYMGTRSLDYVQLLPVWKKVNFVYRFCLLTLLYCSFKISTDLTPVNIQYPFELEPLKSQWITIYSQQVTFSLLSLANEVAGR